MNAFLVAGTVLLAGFVPLLGATVRRRPIDALVAVELAGAILVLVLLCLAEGFHRSVYYGVPVIAALLSWISGLIYARFLGRYL